jgi:hypothetical protein
MFYEGRIGGANTDFFTLDTFAEFAGNDYFSSDPTFPSIVVASIPVGSYVRTDVFDVRAQLADDDTSVHYESAAYYGIRCGFNSMSGSNVTIYDRMTNYSPNTVLFQGTQVPCGGVDGKPGLVVENAGHHGLERPGDRLMRERGMSVRENLSTPLLVR